VQLLLTVSLNVLQKESALVVTVIFLIGFIVWLQRAQRKHEQLCCCQSVTDRLQKEPSLASDRTEFISRGGQRDSGQWFSQVQPFHVHIYSAFFDTRRTLRSQSQVALIAVIDRRLSEEPRLWCHVWYEAIDDAITLPAHPMPIGAGKLMADGNELMEHVITCPVTTDVCAPISVALAWGASVGERTTFRVPIELAQNTSNQQNLAVCVSATFGPINTRRLIEWLEMQQILGVQMVIVYNHSVSQSVGHVLSQYARAPAVSRLQVELRQTRAFMSDDVLLHMSPVINDCMYRFSAQFRYFAVIDLDEVIIPRHVYTMPALVKSLSLGNEYPVALFTFRNAYFFLDIAVQDIERPLHPNAALSTYLVHRRRLSASPPAYSVKSVVNAEACVAMHNHYCWTYADDVLSYWTLRVDVEPSDALLHHYKRCHLDTYLQQPGHCKNVMASTVVDNVIDKYSRLLADRLYQQYATFNMTGVS